MKQSSVYGFQYISGQYTHTLSSEGSTLFAHKSTTQVKKEDKKSTNMFFTNSNIKANHPWLLYLMVECSKVIAVGCSTLWKAVQEEVQQEEDED